MPSSRAHGWAGRRLLRLLHVAYIGLHHRAGLTAGETLLVLGGAGRTGSAANQVGKAMGASVIAIARTQAKADFCRGQGADHVIDLGQPFAGGEIQSWTDTRGVDVVYDTVGGQAYIDATAVLAPRGARVLIVGFAGGKIANLDAYDLLMRDYSVAGVVSAFRDEVERAETVRVLSSMLASGRITPPVTSVYPFDQVPHALAQRASEATGQSAITVAGAEQR
jgi:NADPH2:quinone reductase